MSSKPSKERALPLRTRIKEYLSANGRAGSKTIAESLGEKPSSVSKTLSRMQKSAEVAYNHEWGTFALPTSDVLRGPDPIGGKAPGKQSVRRDQSVPTWSPGIEYDRDGGELRTLPMSVGNVEAPVDPDEQALFEQFGLDPAKWTITNLRRSLWQKQDGDWLEAFRASFSPRKVELFRLSEVDLNQYLVDYPQSAALPGGGDTWMIPVGDLQLGKPDGGGTAGIVERFARCTEAVRKDLEARGGVERLILPHLGDACEGLVSQSGRGVARMDRTMTEQVRIFRRMLLHQIGVLAPLAGTVLMPVVGGNHDMAYRQQTMSPNDSWAIDAASAIADSLALTDKFNHVEWLFPELEQWGVTVNVGTEDNPYVVHFEHGHQARTPAKMIDWWKGQAHGRQGAGAADLLVTAHWHHLRVEATGGGKFWLQVPALEGGSDWFRAKSGEESAPGMLQLRIVGGSVGWDNLSVHQ